MLELIIKDISSVYKYTIGNSKVILEVIEETISLPEIADKIIFDLISNEKHWFSEGQVAVDKLPSKGKWSAGGNSRSKLAFKKQGELILGFETTVYGYGQGESLRISTRSNFNLISHYLDPEFYHLLGEFYISDSEEPFVFMKSDSYENGTNVILHELIEIRLLK